MKKNIFLIFLFQNFFILSQSSVIVLYGCSSSGKTSIATELIKTLPGKWKYIASNQFRSTNSNNGNSLLWRHINSQLSGGYNIIVDTHNNNFLINDKNTNLLVVLLHCPIEKLIEHVQKRNTNVDANSHRRLKSVFNEFCHKYKVANNNQKPIDSLDKDELKNRYSWTTYFALKKIINNFFTNTNNSIVHITPCITNYDCIVNTGNLSISSCSQKIHNELLKKLKNIPMA